MADNIGMFRVSTANNTYISGTKPGDFVITTTQNNSSIVAGPSNCAKPLIVTSSNVGIGTNAPIAPLDVVGDASMRSNLSVGGKLIAGDIVPSTGLQYNIGTSNNRFKEAWIETVHIGANTLYIGDTPVMGTSNDTIMIRADKDQSVTVKTTGTGVTTMQSEAGVNVTAGAGIIMQSTGMNAQVTVQSSGTGGKVAFGAGADISFAAPSTAFNGNVSMSSNLTVTGNLTVNGTATVINAQTVAVKDNIVLLNHGEVGNGVTVGSAGIEIDRGPVGLNARIIWAESNDTFNVGLTGQEQTIATQPWVSGNYLSLTGGTVTGLVNANGGIATQNASINAGTGVITGRLAWSNLTSVPASSTSAAGIVQLNSSVTSTSTTQAATPSAVKSVYDTLMTTTNSLSNYLPLTGGTLSRALTIQAASNSDVFIINTTNAPGQDAIVSMQTAGSSAGNPMAVLAIKDKTGWTMGVDNADNKFKVANQIRTIANPYLTIDTTGLVNIGSSGATTTKLNVQGQIVCTDDITAFSDARFKTDIQVIENALDKVKRISGYTYRRSDQNAGGKRYAGVLAQEIREVLPEVVSENEDDGFLRVAYGNITALLIEAIKTLEERVAELEVAQ